MHFASPVSRWMNMKWNAILGCQTIWAPKYTHTHRTQHNNASISNTFHPHPFSISCDYICIIIKQATSSSASSSSSVQYHYQRHDAIPQHASHSHKGILCEFYDYSIIHGHVSIKILAGDVCTMPVASPPPTMDSISFIFKPLAGRTCARICTRAEGSHTKASSRLNSKSDHKFSMWLPVLAKYYNRINIKRYRVICMSYLPVFETLVGIRSGSVWSLCVRARVLHVFMCYRFKRSYEKDMETTLARW